MLYTDGITEATDDDLDMFGEERLEALLRQHADEGARGRSCGRAPSPLAEFTGREQLRRRRVDAVIKVTLKSGRPDAGWRVRSEVLAPRAALDAERLAVLRHRAPRDVHAALAELLDQLVVGQRVVLVSLSTICFSVSLTACWLTMSPASDMVPLLKKRFMSKMPCGVWMYLPEIGAADRRDVHVHRVGDVLHLHRLQVLHAVAQEALLARTISLATRSMVFCRWCTASMNHFAASILRRRYS
jgi:hypothetical protein